MTISEQARRRGPVDPSAAALLRRGRAEGYVLA